ncbi:hypothetical protein [Methylophaga sp.]|uniref:hypothetical protein n=1 Tax=Methylophaga sp. TaxID=2024840 RepID=UPI003A95DC91
MIQRPNEYKEQVNFLISRNTHENRSRILNKKRNVKPKLTKMVAYIFMNFEPDLTSLGLVSPKSFIWVANLLLTSPRKPDQSIIKVNRSRASVDKDAPKKKEHKNKIAAQVNKMIFNGFSLLAIFSYKPIIVLATRSQRERPVICILQCSFSVDT